MKLLFVDDHPLFLAEMENLLTALGIEVIGTAADGFEAFILAQALHPDLILMDLEMPRCNGLTATRLIKAELPDIRIVMLTESEEDDEEDLSKALADGASGYLVKTVGSQQFLAQILDLMASASTQPMDDAASEPPVWIPTATLPAFSSESELLG